MSRSRNTGGALPNLTRSGNERPFPGGKAKTAAIGGSASGSAAGASVAFRETIYGNGDRSNVLFLLPSDSRFYLNGWTRYRINQKVEWLWQTFGIVKELGAGIARHTVGKGIRMVIDSNDHEFATEAEEDFGDYAATPNRCDISGRRDFYDQQDFGVRQYLYRGEFFAAHVDNPRWKGEPSAQIFDSQEIVSPDKAGKDVIDGVKVGKYNEAVEYYARALGDETVPIPAGKMMHWFTAHAANQVRGLSHFAQAVNNLVDFNELARLETRTAKAHKLVALVLKGIAKKKGRGAFGKIAQSGSNDPDFSDKDTAQLEQVYGGAGAGIAYLGEDGDVKLVSSNSPSPLTEEFITNLLMRDVTLAPGVPMEFFWNIAKLGGANVRFILSKADLFFQTLADGLISRFCTPLAYRYLQWRIKNRKLRKPTDPNWKITWQTPRRITVDNGNDNGARLNNLAAGVTTLKREYGDLGENWIPHTRQWIAEPIKFLEMAKSMLAQSQLTPEQQDTILNRWAENLPLWRTGMPGATGQPAAPDPEDDPKDEPKEKKKPEPPKDEPPAAPKKK